MHIKQQPWEKLALCAQEENSKWDWFSEDTSEMTMCKSICNKCPMKETCMDFSLSEGHVWGIWGGLEPKELQVLLNISDAGEPFSHPDFAWCPKPGCMGEMVRKPVSQRSKVKRGQIWISCVSCDYSFARYENDLSAPFKTPSLPRTKTKEILVDDNDYLRFSDEDLDYL